MTAGNLFCGFAATLKIVEGALLQASNPDAAGVLFHTAIWFILGACIFDLLDGRLARLGGQESAFGREFDSLADIVSFGLAPALMVYRIVLEEFPRAGWVVAFVYLACGAMRLARFNCVAAEQSAATRRGDKNFTGFPIPAAAGLIASLTLFMLWLAEGEHELGRWKWVLPPLMLFLSFMMFSRFRYPSFKAVNWRTKRSIPRFLIIIFIVGFHGHELRMDAGDPFPLLLLLRIFRPWLSREWRREIEEEIGEEQAGETVTEAPDHP